MSNSTGDTVMTEFKPETVIGKPYSRGMLPYGGGVGVDGKIVFARSQEETEERLNRLRSLLKNK